MQASSRESTVASVPISGSTSWPLQPDVGAVVQEVEWLFAVTRGGRTLLYTLRIKPIQTGATVMQLLRKEFTETIAAKRWFSLCIVTEDAVISRHTAAERPCHAILIKVTTDMASVAMVLAMVIAFCIAAGIATDFLAKDAEIGLAVCTGAEGIFALIQGSLVGVDARSMNSKANR
ncbi:hypothetical protein ST47_g9364 [Ascochyta rabiei]|uniref:Uncharacterized protein n=1 Tax=Didymella rabiei TaxID=5454 RepID=A0A162XG42_DIDRA|nr:hypothetical protein ST47_g9364 [Ascochyta rabiei]